VAHPAQLLDRCADVDPDAGLLLDEVAHRRPSPRNGEIERAAVVGELRRAVQARARWATSSSVIAIMSV